MLKYSKGKYWWKGNLQQAALVRSLGFIWDEEFRLWYTKKPLTANKLVKHAVNDDTKYRLFKSIQLIEKNIVSSWATSCDTKYKAPDGLEYLPFQNAGIDFIVNRDNTILADDMGLGKTVQTIGAINEWSNLNKILIVCPASVKYQWRNEITKWCHKFYNILVVSGKTDMRMKYPENEIIIMNFDIASCYRNFISTTKWDLKIVDEFHYLMTPKAQWTKAVLSARAKKNIFCSGSPGERPIELWPSLRHLDPNTYVDFWRYAKYFCNAKVRDVGFRNRGRWDLSGALNLEELYTDLRSNMMIRRLKSQVLPQIGEKTKVVIPLSFGRKLSTHLAYEDVFVCKMSKRSVRINRPTQYNYDKAIAVLTTEKINCDENMAKVRRDIGLIKLPMVIDFIDNALLSKDKIICYAYHRDVVARLAEHYSGKCTVINGGTHASSRYDRIQKFKNDPECRVFIGQIKAVGTGTDGLQEITDTAIFAEIDWSFKNMIQAEDRVHRIGQKGSATYYYLVVDGSLESYMAKKLQLKKKNYDTMLDYKYAKRKGGEIFV